MLSPVYSQSSHSLPTSEALQVAANNGYEMKNKVVEMRSAGCDFAGNGKLSHDTTMERIGWRVIPAADLG
jgi:hypothetical protein